MKEELPDAEVEALLRWCGMAKNAAEQRVADEPEEVAKRPDNKPTSNKPGGKVGHPYRRRLNHKGERS
jgi:hypothetical protein